MELYKEMYFHLFREIEKAVSQLRQVNVGLALETLQRATEHTEEMYISAEDDCV